MHKILGNTCAEVLSSYRAINKLIESTCFACTAIDIHGNKESLALLTQRNLYGGQSRFAIGAAVFGILPMQPTNNFVSYVGRTWNRFVSTELWASRGRVSCVKATCW